MPATRYVAFLVVPVLFLAPALGDFYAPSTPEVFSSPSGKHLVRIEAADSVENAKYYWKHTEFNVFSYNPKKEEFERLTKFDVEGHPLRLFINDAGTRIVTIDQHFGVGYGQIAAIYDFNGKRLAQWKLTDLFDVESLFDRRNFRRSTSSIYWRGDVGWSFDQKTIWISAPTRYESHDDGSYTITHPADLDSYEINLEKVEMKRVPAKNKKAEQGGAGEAAARSESEIEP